jgi:hypothetical protein
VPEMVPREEELLRRVASAFATAAELRRGLGDDLEELPSEGPLSAIPGFLSALDHDLAGTMGCLEEAEWNVGRRAKVIAYLAASGVVELPDEMEVFAGVDGWCPMGCGPGLTLTGHEIRCTNPECPNPTAAAEMLSEAALRQRREEEAAATSDRFALEGRLEGMESLVRVLLGELKGAWWLKAAAAYQGLDRMVHRPEEAGGEG